jgi:hypothetical protein
MQIAPSLGSLMRKAGPAIITGIVVLLLGATPTTAAAQVTGHWDCGRSSQCATVMGAASGDRSFSTADECNRWGRQNIPGGYTCSGGAGNRGMTLRGSPPAIVVRSAIGCGFGGAVLGSLAHDKNDKNLAPVGAMALASLCAMGGSKINSSDWSRGGELVVMTLAGCGMGAATGTYMDGQVVAGTPEALEPKKMSQDTAIGCGAGFLAGAILPSFIRSAPVIGSRRSIGVRIHW